jgi:phage anti-repressor protein
MGNLIDVAVQDGRQTVNARELYMALEVGRDFSNWIKDRIKKYGFLPGEDYFVVEGYLADQAEKNDFEPPNSGRKVRGGDRRSKDYILSIDMAKEIAMVENNERGKEIRKHLIKVEKAWNNPAAVIQRAMQLGDIGYIANIEPVFKEIAELGRSMIFSPFTTFLDYGIPKKAWLYPTETGGRVYMLQFDGRSRSRQLAAFGPDGKLLDVAVTSRTADDLPMDTGFSTLVDRHKKVLGNSLARKQVEFDDCYNWKVSLAIKKLSQSFLSAPEEKKALTASGEDTVNHIQN